MTNSDNLAAYGMEIHEINQSKLNKETNPPKAIPAFIWFAAAELDLSSEDELEEWELEEWEPDVDELGDLD